ncbi:MAG: DMT family transporter [SAR324 cluster bacterium]|nr:DMT family transporter [SAR324 cluster bacterium]
MAIIPVLFVWLWSTGFIGAKFGLPYSEPFTFLLLRMLLTLMILGCIILFTRAEWPSSLSAAGHLAISGSLVHAAYLGGVFSAIDAGMAAGLSAVIVGLQPIMTTIFVKVFTGASFTRRQYSGLILGFVGIFCVVLGDRLLQNEDLTSGISLKTLAFSLLALFGISFGTFYQKKFCSKAPLLSGAFMQYVGAVSVFAVGAISFETMQIEFSMQFIFALSWLIFGLSISAILLLLFMIKNGEVERVASLFYLVAPVTTVEAYLLFDERFGPITWLGIAFSVLGVYLFLSTPRGNRAFPA